MLGGLGLYDNEFLENDLDILEAIEHGLPRRRYHRSNYFEELDELQFFQRFRLTKETTFGLLNEIENALEYGSNL